MEKPKPRAVEGEPADHVTGRGQELTQPQRRRLPDERRALTHHFSVGGQEGYLTVGLYEDGVPGEVFIKMPTQTGDPAQALAQVVELGDAPACVQCGALMVRNGSCYRCLTCGGTNGCS